MPVAVPNSFHSGYYQDNSSKNNRYDINYSSSKDNNLMDENQNQSYYLYMNRLEEKIRRLENINDIFLNIIREKTTVNKENLYKNYLYSDLSTGPYPYLSFDKNKNKTLLYLNRDSINNNKINDGKYKENYLLPILPKYNSIQEKNRISYLLNEEKLKYLRKDSEPYFYYDFKRYNKSNIPQKINSVQYFNKKIDYEKFNSSNNINIQVNPEKESKGKTKNSKKNIENKSNKSNNKIIKDEDIKDEINKLNDNLNKRLLKIEDLQKNHKKDIDYLMGKSKGNNKSEKKKKKETNKKEEEKKNDAKNNKDNKDDKNDKESDDYNENEDEKDDEEEKELGIKSIKSESDD